MNADFRKICEGDYEHYISRSRAVNDLHGSGPFVLMCSEIEEQDVK